MAINEFYLEAAGNAIGECFSATTQKFTPLYMSLLNQHGKIKYDTKRERISIDINHVERFRLSMVYPIELILFIEAVTKAITRASDILSNNSCQTAFQKEIDSIDSTLQLQDAGFNCGNYANRVNEYQQVEKVLIPPYVLTLDPFARDVKQRLAAMFGEIVVSCEKELDFVSYNSIRTDSIVWESGSLALDIFNLGICIFDAMVFMGDIAEHVLDDPSEAAKWYRMSAESGDMNGARCYADMLMCGKGIKQDTQEARKYYLLAADKGQPESQFMMGQFFLSEGKLGEALKYLKLSADNGYQPAAQKLEEVRQNAGTKKASSKTKPRDIFEEYTNTIATGHELLLNGDFQYVPKVYQDLQLNN